MYTQSILTAPGNPTFHVFLFGKQLQKRMDLWCSIQQKYHTTIESSTFKECMSLLQYDLLEIHCYLYTQLPNFGYQYSCFLWIIDPKCLYQRIINIVCLTKYNNSNELDQRIWRQIMKCLAESCIKTTKPLRQRRFLEIVLHVKLIYMKIPCSHVHILKKCIAICIHS